MARANDVILIVHDGSEYGYSGLRSLEATSVNSRQRTYPGLPQAQLVGRPGGQHTASLGLLNQILYRRPHVPKGGDAT